MQDPKNNNCKLNEKSASSVLQLSLISVPLFVSGVVLTTRPKQLRRFFKNNNIYIYSNLISLTHKCGAELSSLPQSGLDQSAHVNCLKARIYMDNLTGLARSLQNIPSDF